MSSRRLAASILSSFVSRMIQQSIPNLVCPSVVAILSPVFARELKPLAGSSTHVSPECDGRGAGSLGLEWLLQPFQSCFSPQRLASVRNELITIVCSSIDWLME